MYILERVLSHTSCVFSAFGIYSACDQIAREGVGAKRQRLCAPTAVQTMERCLGAGYIRARSIGTIQAKPDSPASSLLSKVATTRRPCHPLPAPTTPLSPRPNHCTHRGQAAAPKSQSRVQAHRQHPVRPKVPGSGCFSGLGPTSETALATLFAEPKPLWPR